MEHISRILFYPSIRADDVEIALSAIREKGDTGRAGSNSVSHTLYRHNERAGFIEQACAGDEAPRLEVESLLSYDDQARSFIETPPANVAAAILAAAPEQSMVGRTLGHYRILSLKDRANWRRSWTAPLRRQDSAPPSERWRLQRLERLNQRKERGAYVPAMAFVTLYLRLGDCEQTNAWLAKAVPEGNWPVLEINLDPRYESLRSAPRFVRLAHQMRFHSMADCSG